MTLTAENLMNNIHQIINDLKQDIFQRFNYNLDENLTYLDLTRNLILLENVFSEESIKRSQELQRRLTNQHPHHQSTNSMMNRSYNTANYNPFNIQNQEDNYANQSYSHQPNYQQPPTYDLDSSKDSIPQFHKQLLKEYKNSMDQLKKQNKIIRTIVQENAHQHSHYRSRDHQDKDYIRLDHNLNTFETNLVNQSSADEFRRHHSKSHNTLNRSQDEIQHRRSQKIRSSAKKQYYKAEQELQELQVMREKELSKIKQIERAIRKREEIAAPQHISSSEMEQLEYVKSQKKVKDKQYILRINEQISKLDKEIRQITSYIQDCILKE